MIRRLVISVTTALLLTAAISLQVLSQTPPSQGQPVERKDGGFRLNVNVNLVEVHVSVLDKGGDAVEGLKQENFQVLENNVAQDVTLFKHEDVPVSIGMVIDNSGSMRNKKDKVHSAALSFVKESNPDDQTFIVAFERDAFLQQDFTGSMGDLVDALDNLDPRMETAMYDAIYLSVDHVKKGRLDKKVLLVISDGEDTASKWGYNKVLEHVKNAKDVVVYAVGILEENDGRSGGLFGRSPQKKAREGLTEIAELSGGQAFFPKDIDEVAEICRRIARNLRNQYTIGYSPKNDKPDGAWRELTVKQVNFPKNLGKVEVRHRKGYTAPGGSTPKP
ncbi:MAG TPA: VWA domain-containing protein [Terriglobia bacterium]|nr:VWA domain-containing protein [Terriglobia bacterium]